MAKTVLLLPPDLAPAAAPLPHQTPYGVAHWQDDALVRVEGLDARALIYAAKEAGATRLLAGERAVAVSPLLEDGDLVVPADTVDQTRLRPFTFFVGKGYGFIKLNPPFCPDLMTRLLVAGRAVQGRTFQRAVYVGIDGPRLPTPAEALMYRRWGADLAGTGLLPEAYLARELELCYGALALVGEGDAARLLQALRAVAQSLGEPGQPAHRDCACSQTMAHLKASGQLGEDWRQW